MLAFLLENARRTAQGELARACPERSSEGVKAYQRSQAAHVLKRQATVATSGRLTANHLAILVLIGISGFLAAPLDVPMIRSDGFAYYIWLETLVRNHTLDLSLAANHFARFITYQVRVNNQTGRYNSAFAFGAAIFWAPFYSASLLLDQFKGLGLIHARDQVFLALQGDTLVHSFAVAFATWTYVTVTLVLSFLMSRRLLGIKAAVLVTLLAFLGTPLYYYTVIEPTMAHGVATFAVTVPIWLTVQSGLLPLNDDTDAPIPAPRSGSWLARQPQMRFARPWYWLMVGLLTGLAGTVRWQLILLAIPLALALLFRARLIDLVTFAVGVGAIFITVPLSWIYMYGSPSPTAVGTVRDWIPTGWEKVLIAPASGMFAWAPLTLLAVIGLACMLIDGRRRIAIVLTLIVVLQILINSVAGDPTAGSSFGMRRMTEMYPVFVIGLSWLLYRVNDRSPALHGLVLTLMLACTAFTMLLFFTYIAVLIDPATGTVIDAIVVWLPPHTAMSLARVLSLHINGFSP